MSAAEFDELRNRCTTEFLRGVFSAGKRPIKGTYIGAPACFALELACRQICEAFGGHHCYVVGSALDQADWRDVDVRYILSDEEFSRLFPDAGQCWEQDARWLLLTVAISEHLSTVTGLPIDFQFQPETHANERHKGKRSCIGLHIAREVKRQP